MVPNVAGTTGQRLTCSIYRLLNFLPSSAPLFAISRIEVTGVTRVNAVSDVLCFLGVLALDVLSGLTPAAPAYVGYQWLTTKGQEI